MKNMSWMKNKYLKMSSIGDLFKMTSVQFNINKKNTDLNSCLGKIGEIGGMSHSFCLTAGSFDFVIVFLLHICFVSVNRLENPPGENERSHMRQSFNR